MEAAFDEALTIAQKPGKSASIPLAQISTHQAQEKHRARIPNQNACLRRRNARVSNQAVTVVSRKSLRPESHDRSGQTDLPLFGVSLVFVKWEHCQHCHPQRCRTVCLRTVRESKDPERAREGTSAGKRSGDGRAQLPEAHLADVQDGRGLALSRMAKGRPSSIQSNASRARAPAPRGLRSDARCAI